MTALVPAPVLPPLASFQALMDQWTALLRQVDRGLEVYQWKPATMPQTPCLWNWMLPSPYTVRDVAHSRDTYNIETSLALEHTDTADEMAKLAYYVDRFRAVVDPVLWTPGNPGAVLGGTAARAVRTAMRTASDTAYGTPLLCMVFSMTFDQDRVTREV